MRNFIFHNPTELIFGQDTQQKVAQAIKKYGGSRVLVVYGGGSVIKTGLLDEVRQELNKENLYFIELGGVVPNPRWSLAKKGAEIAREQNIDFVLGVGGGSVIDTVKAIALQAVYEGDVWTDFYRQRKQAQKALPTGNILTIAAAGSESSDTSVITNEEEYFKIGYTNSNITPKFAILNPKLLFTVPKYQIACGIVDMLAHLMERYFTNEKSVDLTDRLIEATMKTIIHYAPIVMRDPTNYDAQAEIMFAGTLAHNNLLNCGRIGDWGTHNIEHQLSLYYDIAHGAGLAIMFPAWIKYVNHINKPRFAQFFQNVFGVTYSLTDLDLIINEGILKLEQFYVSLGMPIRLSEVNIDDSKFAEMAHTAVTAKPLGNFLKLGEKEIVDILNLAK